MIFKIILLLIVVGAIYFIFFKKGRVVEEKREDSKKSNKNSEELIPCYKCGTLTTESETIISNGQQFCSKECAGL